jgi:hypothetical protein
VLHALVDRYSSLLPHTATGIQYWISGRTRHLHARKIAKCGSNVVQRARVAG